MSTGASKLDEFESMFRSALHEVFHYERPELRRALVVDDGTAAECAALAERIATFLRSADVATDVAWDRLDRAAWAGGPEHPIPTLLARLAEAPPDLVVCRRHLLGAARDLPYTLGSVVDTLTQAQPAPVLLLPTAALPEAPRTVLAVTDRMTGQDALVSWAARVARPGGTLVLAHIEDDDTLERYLGVITRIRQIDTETARETLPPKLLDLPRGYLGSVRAGLERAGLNLTVTPVVRMGHALSDYCQLVDEHAVDLVVVDTKDDRQRAMHGLAHALAVEIRHRPLLLL